MSDESKNESPWDTINTDFSSLEKSPWEQIPDSVFRPIETPAQPEFSPPYSLEQIKQAKKKDRAEAFHMELTNAMAKLAQARATGELSYEPTHHEDGWTFSMQTSNGIVGLASLARIQLVLPKNLGLSNTAIQSILEVEPGKPITSYFSYVTDDIKNDDLFEKLKKEKVAQMENGIIVENDTPERGKTTVYALAGENFVPAQFMSAPLPEGGRIWIGTKVTGYNFHKFPIVTNDGELRNWEYVDKPDSQYDHLITAPPLAFDWNSHTPDGARNDSKHLSVFRKRFIALASIAAARLGKLDRLTVNGAEIYPQDLRKQGYYLEWLQGQSGVWKPKQGYREEVLIRARKDEDFVFLESGYDLFNPWMATISRKIPSTINSHAELEEFINESLNY